VQKKSETGIFKVFSHVVKTFPVLIIICRATKKILREKTNVIGGRICVFTLSFEIGNNRNNWQKQL